MPSMQHPTSLVSARRLCLCLSSLVMIGTFGACAQGISGEELPNDFYPYDAMQSEASPPEAGPSLPQEDAAVPVPPDSSVNPTSDASNPAPVDAGGGAADTGTTPADTGVTPVADASRDTGTPPMDAAPDTSTPVRDAQPPLDTSTQPVDTGAPDVSQPNNNMCATTQAYPTTTACAKCTCTKCAAPVASCYASTDAAKNTQCIAVQTCAEKNTCWGQECYCGGSALCLNPDGACRQVIETATGTNNALEINEMSNDTSTAVGRAKAIGSCQSTQCKSECGL
jgi:hypothetical protein